MFINRKNDKNVSKKKEKKVKRNKKRESKRKNIKHKIGMYRTQLHIVITAHVSTKYGVFCRSFDVETM